MSLFVDLPNRLIPYTTIGLYISYSVLLWPSLMGLCLSVNMLAGAYELTVSRYFLYVTICGPPRWADPLH